MPHRYVVTGGAGFIGSHLVARLLAEGHRVCVIDNFLTGRRENLAHLSGDWTLVERSASDLSALTQHFAGAAAIFHLAALPSVPLSVDDPATAHEHTLTTTVQVLTAARLAGVRRIVYASSSAVYGEQPPGASAENLTPLPLSPYGAAKLAGEYYCHVFHHLHGLETVSLRFFNVFGPRQDPNSTYAAVIPKFITAMLAGRAPVIFGDGTQTRDFAYVGNIVQGMLLAAHAPGAAGQVINLADGRQTDLLTLVEHLNRSLGTTLAPVFAPERPGDIKHSTADIRRAQELLGYQPPYSLEEGLALTAAAYRGQQAG